MLSFILLFIPACISTLLYLKVRPGERPVWQIILIALSFAFFINMLLLLAVSLRGHEYLLLPESNLANIALCLKYMAISSVFACLLPFLAAGISGFLKSALKKILVKKDD
jgi:hypothetical protein